MGADTDRHETYKILGTWGEKHTPQKSREIERTSANRGLIKNAKQRERKG